MKDKRAPGYICIILGGLLLGCLIILFIVSREILEPIYYVLLAMLGAILLLGGIGTIKMEKDEKRMQKIKEQINNNK